MPLLELPFDLIHQIQSLLLPLDVLRLSFTCKRLSALLDPAVIEVKRGFEDVANWEDERDLSSLVLEFMRPHSRTIYKRHMTAKSWPTTLSNEWASLDANRISQCFSRPKYISDFISQLRDFRMFELQMLAQPDRGKLPLACLCLPSLLTLTLIENQDGRIPPDGVITEFMRIASEVEPGQTWFLPELRHIHIISYYRGSGSTFEVDVRQILRRFDRCRITIELICHIGCVSRTGPTLCTVKPPGRNMQNLEPAGPTFCTINVSGRHFSDVIDIVCDFRLARAPKLHLVNHIQGILRECKPAQRWHLTDHPLEHIRSPTYRLRYKRFGCALDEGENGYLLLEGGPGLAGKWTPESYALADPGCHQRE